MECCSREDGRAEMERITFEAADADMEVKQPRLSKKRPSAFEKPEEPDDEDGSASGDASPRSVNSSPRGGPRKGLSEDVAAELKRLIAESGKTTRNILAKQLGVQRDMLERQQTLLEQVSSRLDKYAREAREQSTAAMEVLSSPRQIQSHATPATRMASPRAPPKPSGAVALTLTASQSSVSESFLSSSAGEDDDSNSDGSWSNRKKKKKSKKEKKEKKRKKDRRGGRDEDMAPKRQVHSGYVAGMLPRDSHDLSGLFDLTEDGEPAGRKKHVRKTEAKSTGLLAFVKGDTFKVFTTTLIISNSVFIAMQTQHALDNLEENAQPMWLQSVDLIYCIIFAIEISLRLLAHRMDFFTSSAKWWNYFDLFLVFSAINDQIANLIMLAQGDAASAVSGSSDDEEDGGSNLTFLRIMRLFRILRVVRLFKFCPQLTLMLNEIVEAMTAVIWLFILLGVILFILSLVFMTATIEFLKAEPAGTPGEAELRENMAAWFGTFPRAMLSLFKSMSVGIIWETIGDSLWDVHFMYGLLFLAYIGFAVFGAVNVVTGVFVESTNETRRKELRDFKDETRMVLRSIDESEKGYVTREEFLEYVDDDYLADLLTFLEMDKAEAVRSFDLMDTNSEQFVSLGRMVSGFLKLVTEPKGSDLVMLRLESQRVANDLHNFFCFVESNFRDMGLKTQYGRRYMQKRTDTAN